MRSQLGLLFSLFFMGMLLTGCPYESNVPVTEKAADIPSNFIGKWVNVRDFSPFGQTTYYEFQSKDKKQFTITKYEYADGDESNEPSVYKGHFSNVNGTLFMNLIYVSDEATTYFASGGSGQKIYYIYRVRPFKDYFVVDGLSTNITETFNTSNELKSYIEKHMKNDLFFDNGQEAVLTFMRKP